MAGRLLLIGDVNNDLTELKMAFESLGLVVELAPDGLAGLEKGREFHPDLVVTEILTNRLSGFELASRIVSGTAGFAAPVIFYTEFYRDEKARREVLAKYGASQYFVRPFQKDALKKSVGTHFQEFLSSLTANSVAVSVPETPANGPEVSTVVPQLSRAAAAAEQQTATSVSGRPNQPGRPGGFAGEVPSRFRAFTTVEQTTSADTATPETQSVAANVEEPAKPTVAMPFARTETAQAPASVSKPRERNLLLPVEEPSWIGRLIQSVPFKIAGVVIVAAFALYLARDRFQGRDKQVLTQAELPIATQTSPPVQTVAEPEAPPAAVTPSIPPAQDASQVSEAKAGTELAKPSLTSASDVDSVPDSPKRTTTTESALPPATRERSPALSIQDVTGSGRGPVLRKMKPINLSPDLLNGLSAKSIVVRVVIDRAGKVTEVAAVNPESGAISLPPSALAAIRQWEFSSTRRKDTGEAVKYFSLKVQNPR